MDFKQYRAQKLLIEKSDIEKDEFLKAIDAVIGSVTVDKDHDIPYLAGYSKDGKVIYLDKEYPQYLEHDGKKLDMHKAVILHEITEKSFLAYHTQKFQYTQAHQFATRLEKEFVDACEFSWSEYDKHTGIHVKNCREREVYKNLPKDLDLTPYEDDKDTFLLDKIHRDMKTN